VLGVALFEVGCNIYDDYLAAREVFRKEMGVELRLLVEVPGLGTAQLTERDVKVARELKEGAFEEALGCDCVAGEARALLRECEKRLRELNEGRLRKPKGSGLGAFDVLAHLRGLRGQPLGDPDCLVYCLDRKLGLSSKLSPELRELLQLR